MTETMMMMLILLFGLVAVSYGQSPITCESPKLWEGERIFVDRYKHFYERSFIFYDEANQRVRTQALVREGFEDEYLDTLRLYSEKKEYRVNLLTKKCHVTALNHGFRPIGVPKEATFLFMAEIGAAQVPNEHLTVVTFYGNATEDNVRYSSQVTYPDCVPVGDNYFNDVTGYFESRYFNIRPEISDPSVFEVPIECKAQGY